MAVKNAKVSDFNNKSLNTSEDSSNLYMNPQHPRTNALLNWFEHGGAKQPIQSITNAGQGGEGIFNQDNYRLIDEMKNALLLNHDPSNS